MSREAADGKLRTSPGICDTLFRFFAKHFAFYADRNRRSGNSRSVSGEEDYEVAIEHVLIRNMRQEEKMRSGGGGGEKGVMRKKPAAMAKKGGMAEELRLESSVDERSDSFIKKRKEVFFA